LAFHVADRTASAQHDRTRPRVAAIVLNWNRSALTRRAIESLEAQRNVALSTIVVDNGSHGDDVAEIRSTTSATVIALPENVGFARAVNTGATAAMRAGARYVLLFNNDARLEASSPVLETLIATLEGDASLGAAGATIGNDDDAMSVQSVGYRLSMWFPIAFARKSVSGAVEALRADEYLSGSCLLVRCSAFAAVGGFDPDFFFYGDDVDFGRRLHTAGYGSALISIRGVRHERGSSIRVGSPAYAYTALRSHLILIHKHARWYHVPTAYATLVVATLVLTLRALRENGPAVGIGALRAWYDFASHRWGGFHGARLAAAPRPSPEDLR
jgi:N-acetylglucosaminyl-diphospho-decaprenol L-rhamnosyltransferase